MKNQNHDDNNNHDKKATLHDLLIHISSAFVSAFALSGRKSWYLPSYTI